jgi:O-antigen/teichoic acid export membrane protein
MNRGTDDAVDPADVRATTLKGLRWTVIARPATEIIALGAMVVLARLIVPADFGRFAVAAIVVGFATVPAAGVGVALVQRAHVTRDHLQAGQALAVLTSVILIGLIFVAAGVLISPVFGPRTADLVRLATPLCLVSALSTVPSALLQRRLAFRLLGLIDVSSTAIQAAASVTMAIAGLQGASLVLGMLAGALVTTGLSWAWAPAPAPWLRAEAAREVMAYGLPASLAAIGWIGFANCDYAIVGARLGVLQAGFYFRAYSLSVGYQNKISQLMNTVGFPVLSRTDSHADRSALRSRMVGLLTMLLFPLLVLLAIVAPVFVPWFFGHQWTPAVVPTQILAIGGAATVVIDAAGAALMASGRPRALVSYGWAHFASYAVAVLLVAPLGIAAVALAAVVVHTAFLLIAYVVLLHGSGETPLLTLWKDIAPAVVSCAGLAAIAVPASFALLPTGIPALAYLGAEFVIAAVAYLLTLSLLFPASLQSLRSIVRHVLPRRPTRGMTPAIVPAEAPTAR